MSGIQDLIQEKIIEVSDAYPSIFTKDDVIKLLINIQNILAEDEVKASENTPILSDLRDRILIDLKYTLSEESKTVINQHDFESNAVFEINYGNQLNVEFDTDVLKEEMEERLDLIVNEFVSKNFKLEEQEH